MGALGNMVNFGTIIGLFFVELSCQQSISIDLLVISCLSGVSMIITIFCLLIWLYLRWKIHQALKKMKKGEKFFIPTKRESFLDEQEMKPIQKKMA